MKTNLLKMKTLKPVLIFSLLLVVCFSCNEEDGIEKQTVKEEEAKQINEELMQLASFSQPDEIKQPELLDEEKPKREEEFECVVRKYKAAPGYDEMLALDPTSEVIYPGAMLKGESIPTGEYIGINGGRAPITLSISLENIDGTASVEIDNPELSEVRNGVKSLLAQGVTGATPAEIVYELEEVYSEEHLNIALGANYRSKNKSVSASFDFSNSDDKYRYILKYLQVYYTIDMDLPDNEEPGSLFTKMPNNLDGTSPVMVSSVKYGRMVLYTVESNYQTSDVKTAFNISFNQGRREGEAEADIDYKSIINKSKIEALVIGGSGSDASKVVTGPSGVYNYITNGGNYSAESPAAPLSYTLRYIKEDFPIARVVLASEYSARSCDLAYPKYKITINQILRTGSGKKEIYGSIEAGIISGYDKDKPVYAKVGGTKQKVSWSKSGKGSNFIQVSSSKTGDISKPITIKDLYKPDFDTFSVYLEAELYDDNGIFGYDYLGKSKKEISLRKIDENPIAEIKSTDDKIDSYTHSLTGFEDKMKVTFTIEKLYD